jgi:hypothetical protein
MKKKIKSLENQSLGKETEKHKEKPKENFRIGKLNRVCSLDKSNERAQ